MYVEDTVLCSNFDRASEFWQQLELTFGLEPGFLLLVGWVRKCVFRISAGKTQLASLDSSSKSAIAVKRIGLSQIKNHLLR